jgi:hypothetical protein
MEKKFSVIGISGAIAIIGTWLIETYAGVVIPAMVAGAAGVLIQVLVSLALPDRMEAE